MPQSLQEPQEQISQAIANVSGSQLWHTWEEFEYHVDVCRITDGAHIEHLYIYFMSFHAVFKMFHVCIYNHFENILISDHPYHL
jgi:hypothetical protein